MRSRSAVACKRSRGIVFCRSQTSQSAQRAQPAGVCEALTYAFPRHSIRRTQRVVACDRNRIRAHVAREAAMHFGLYLKKKGIISAEQLVAALEDQLEHARADRPIGAGGRHPLGPRHLRRAARPKRLAARAVRRAGHRDGPDDARPFDAAVDDPGGSQAAASGNPRRQGVLTERQAASEMAAYRVRNRSASGRSSRPGWFRQAAARTPVHTTAPAIST